MATIRRWQYQGFAYVAPTAPAPIIQGPDEWAQPWSLPQRLSPQRCAEFTAFTYGQPINVNTADEWAQPWSVPVVLSKPRVAEFPSFVSGYDKSVEPGTPYTEWFQNLSIPPKLAWPRATEFPAFTYGAVPIVNTADEWEQPWSLPKYLFTSRRTAEYPAFTYGAKPIVNTADEWEQPWSLPQHLFMKRRTAEYQNLYLSPIAIVRFAQGYIIA